MSIPEPPHPEPPVAAGAGGPVSVVTCGICGAVPDPAGPPSLTWVRERDDRGRDRWLCPACARRHVRDIEARLPAEWW